LISNPNDKLSKGTNLFLWSSNPIEPKFYLNAKLVLCGSEI
jgi:hypothetical protein